MTEPLLTRLLPILLGVLIPQVAVAAAPWGTYPVCTYPGVPIEVHSDWVEAGEEQYAEKIAISACLPIARSKDCSEPEAILPDEHDEFILRTDTLHVSDAVTFRRWQWGSEPPPPSLGDQTDVPLTCTEALRTEVGPDALWSCEFPPETFALRFDADSNGGLDELRLSSNVDPNVHGRRQFPTLNAQICTGDSSTRYRSTPFVRGQGWYTGFDYSTVQVEYTAHLQGRRTLPRVSGVVRLDIEHFECHGSCRSLLWLDVDPVSEYAFWEDFPHHLPAVGDRLLYHAAGLFAGTYRWDTRDLPDGVHSLFFQTTGTDTTTPDAPHGTNMGGLRLAFIVDNEPNGARKCGLGFELALTLAGLRVLGRRRRRPVGGFR